MKHWNLTRAIPGGIYGCALLLKYAGSERIKNMSMGRIHAIIKTALENSVISHYKTLIVKTQEKSELENESQRK